MIIKLYVWGLAFIANVLLMSGCFGGAAFHTKECISEYPLTDYIFDDSSWGPAGYITDKKPSGNPITKADFKKKFGEPNEIKFISENKEMWVYIDDEYCGIMAAYVYAVPLPLYKCNEFNHITFENDQAILIHFQRITTTGYVLFVVRGSDNECPYKKEPPSNIKCPCTKP